MKDSTSALVVAHPQFTIRTFIKRADKIFGESVGGEIVFEMKSIELAQTFAGGYPQIAAIILGDVIDKRMRHPVLHIEVVETVGLRKRGYAAKNKGYEEDFVQQQLFFHNFYRRLIFWNSTNRNRIERQKFAVLVSHGNNNIVVFNRVFALDELDVER